MVPGLNGKVVHKFEFLQFKPGTDCNTKVNGLFFVCKNLLIDKKYILTSRTHSVIFTYRKELKNGK